MTGRKFWLLKGWDDWNDVVLSFQVEAVDSKEGSSPLWDLKRDLVLLREELQEKNVTIRSLKNELLATTGRIQPNSPQSTTSSTSCHNVATQTDRVCCLFSTLVFSSSSSSSTYYSPTSCFGSSHSFTSSSSASTTSTCFCFLPALLSSLNFHSDNWITNQITTDWLSQVRLCFLI